MTNKRALIIDDEPDILELLEITLIRMGLNTDTAANIASAKQKLNDNDYDICLTDMKLPDGNGLELVDFIQQQCPTLPVAMISAHGNMDIAIQALKAGAFDFVSKPVDLSQLRQLVSNALHLSSAEHKQKDSATQIASDEIIGRAPSIVKLRQQISKLCRSQAPVFISGESGSGKELVARAIHYQGPRAKGAFIPVNCGAIPSELLESEFFGHVKGSFSGAHQNKKGLFQAADGGTLFLDEVADLPLEMQVKLLRALQEKKVRPVGGQEEIAVNIRVLSATHKNLQTEVDTGRFRNDLYYRINVIEVAVPPLRDRGDDIVLLAERLLEKIAAEMQLPAPKIDAKALKALQDFAFPGNVRELENTLERAFTLCEYDVINETDLQLPGTTTSKATALSTEKPALYDARRHASLDEYLEDIERTILLDALEQSRWNRTEAAKKLGISFRSIRYRLKKLGLDHD
tara:strand:+ start:320 stop:1699 length:1380 start_codon:yes stop_codon:yes gene_type:complete